MRAFFRAPRTWLVLSITALAVALSAVAWMALSTDARAAKALRTPGAIIAVTRGTEPLAVGAAWQIALGKAFPTLREKVGGIWVQPRTTKRDALVVWQYRGRFLGYRNLFFPELTGDRGEVLRTASACAMHGVGDGYVGEYEIRNYPRRGKLVRIRFRDLETEVPYEPDLVVPNPAVGEYPKWIPASLPDKKRLGDLEVTLQRFETGTRDDYRVVGETRFGLQLRERGRPANSSWGVVRTAILDPTGNRWENQSQSRVARDEISAHAVVTLPEEAAYQLQFELARTGNFPRHEVRRFGNLPTPRIRQVIRLRRSVKLDGCTLELTHLVGAGGDPGLDSWSISDRTVAVVRVTGKLERHGLHSRTWRKGSWAARSPQPMGDGSHRLDLEFPKGKSPLTLELALTPRRTVEFLAHATALADSKARAGR